MPCAPSRLPTVVLIEVPVRRLVVVVSVVDIFNEFVSLVNWRRSDAPMS